VFAKVDARQKTRDEARLAGAQEQFATYLKGGNPAAAFLLYEKMKDVAGGLQLNRGQLLALVKWMHGEKRWSDSAPFMAELIARFPAEADPIRIKLARYAWSN